MFTLLQKKVFLINAVLLNFLFIKEFWIFFNHGFQQKILKSTTVSITDDNNKKCKKVF